MVKRVGLVLFLILSFVQNPAQANITGSCHVLSIASHTSVVVPIDSFDPAYDYNMQSDVGVVGELIPAPGGQSTASATISGLTEGQIVHVSVVVSQAGTTVDSYSCTGHSWNGWLWDFSGPTAIPNTSGFTWQIYPWSPTINIDFINCCNVYKYDYSTNDYSYPPQNYTIPFSSAGISLTVSASGLITVTGAPANTDIIFSLNGDDSPGMDVMAYAMDVVTSRLPGLSPNISNLQSESDGCSFNITNYDPNFTYGFQRDNSQVQIESTGHVRLTGQLPGTAQIDYPSSFRNDYEIVNNVAQKFLCTALPDPRILIEQKAKADADAAAVAAKTQQDHDIALSLGTFAIAIGSVEQSISTLVEVVGKNTSSVITSKTKSGKKKKAVKKKAVKK